MQPVPSYNLHYLEMDISVGGSLPSCVQNILCSVTTDTDLWIQGIQSAFCMRHHSSQLWCYHQWWQGLETLVAKLYHVTYVTILSFILVPVGSWATLYQNYLHFRCLHCTVPTSAFRYWRKQWKTPVKRDTKQALPRKKNWEDALLCDPADCSLTCLHQTATLLLHLYPFAHLPHCMI
jgi:hypothetical protein